MIEEDFPDSVLGVNPLGDPNHKVDPRARAKLREARRAAREAEQSRPRRRPGRPRKDEQKIGDYNVLWAPQKRRDGSPGPQHALLSCPYNEVFFGGARGGGKALPLDENVATPAGYRPMGDIQVGDEVCAPDGAVTRVIGVYPQGLERVWRILLVDNRTVRASAGHLWRLRANGEEMTVTTDCMRKLIRDGAEVALPVESLDNWIAVRFIWECGRPDHTQCIKVDREDGLFVTNDGIITHNTDGAIGVWLDHAARYGEHARGMFLRRQFKQLEEVQKRCSGLFPRIGATFHKGEGMWLFPNGATLKLGHLWDEAATLAYQGHQYSILFIEELTQWPTPVPIDMMRATLRSAAGVPTRLIMTGNPGGAGHGWVRERYVAPAPSGYTPIRDPKTGKVRIYIPSRLSDNIILTTNDPNYESNLRQAGSDMLVRAWLEGDWNIVAGGFFSDILSPDRHFIKPFNIPGSWRYRRAFDWGSSKPASLGIYAVADGNPVPDLDGFTFPRGSLIRIKEWYTVAHKDDGTLKPNEGQRLTNLALGAGIAERSIRYQFSGCVADPSIWNKMGRDSMYSEMQKGALEVGHHLVFSPADNNRVAGWQKMRDMLENAAVDVPESPGLWVFETCNHFIRTVPVLQRDESKPDDLDTAAEDHIADETRYACMSGGRSMKVGDLVGR